jgi:xylulose-5-phosphate/fructose-6-phosphate phosphoketolase
MRTAARLLPAWHPRARSRDYLWSMAATESELAALHRYWCAANYLTVGQIYLRENVLLREPLRPEHIKPRLLGHWGTSPGLSLIYAHVNRLIRRDGIEALYLAGPGHGGPALIANVYLEGTYSEIYPEVSCDERGMRQLFRQFSTPGGVPSHVSVPTPGSIHEGGELGYVLVHAFGAVFDHPKLIAIAVVGDGEAETGPLAGSWSGVRFLNPARDGAVLPILHLNGYKISGPTVFGRTEDADLRRFFESHGYAPEFVEGHEPMEVHRAFAHALERCLEQIRELQRSARTASERPRWPMIVLRTPKGWTGPKELNGEPVEGTFRAHQVPLPKVRDDDAQRAALEAWLRSYEPHRLFDAKGTLVEELRGLAPEGELRMGATSYANGGRRLRTLRLPALDDYALEVSSPGRERAESTAQLGKLLREVYVQNPDSFRLFCPDETHSNRLGAVFQVESRCSGLPVIPSDEHVSADGRVMEILSEHCCEGWLEGYVLTGRHGLFATYEAFAMVAASMIVQHSKWLEESTKLAWRKPVASLNVLLTSTCWRNDHNGFSHQGPGMIDILLSKRGSVARIYLPPDANCLLSVAEHCLHSRDYVNLIAIDKQPQLQYLSLEEAKVHCAQGASIWPWAGTRGEEPDVVLAGIGDVPTQEVIAAAALLREHAPELRVRVVNVVDLMALFDPSVHPHGLPEDKFVELFTRDRPVVIAFHGYRRSIYQVLHGRTNGDRFLAHGYMEQGTTTTPFDMVVLNEMSRYHLCLAVASQLSEPLDGLRSHCERQLQRHHAYVREHFEDMPEVKEWALES